MGLMWVIHYSAWMYKRDEGDYVLENLSALIRCRSRPKTLPPLRSLSSRHLNISNRRPWPIQVIHFRVISLGIWLIESIILFFIHKGEGPSSQNTDWTVRAVLSARWQNEFFLRLCLLDGRSLTQFEAESLQRRIGSPGSFVSTKDNATWPTIPLDVR